MAAQIKLRRSQQKSRDGKEPKRNSRRKSKDMDMEMMVVTATDGQKIIGTSASPSPSSTTDTMSPSLSMSPPCSPSPLLAQYTLTLAAPIPIYPPIPMNQQLISLQQQQFLMSIIQNMAPSIGQQAPLLPGISAGSVSSAAILNEFWSMYLKNYGLQA
ncbi:Protein male abnormal 3 [Caenorhabditis elegans]|nr:Protein male abnormal 3 [Caenorhabditis elegans]CAD59170.2 Protein male abnormal 3 [Caenorhabditis elegans]|eukprot:NP_871909.2 Protein male abnormal 3 [Caenorhabditis elegans]